MRTTGIGALGGALACGVVAFTGTLATAQDCASPQTQLDMNQCAALDYQAADEELNADYQLALRRLEEIGHGAEALRDAQRAWVTFRDKACEAEGAPYEGGSIRPLIVADCLARLTRRRSGDLRALAETN